MKEKKELKSNYANTRKNELIGSCVYTIKDGKFKGARFQVVDQIGTDTYLLQAVAWLDNTVNYCIVRNLDWFKDKVITPYCENQEYANWLFENIERHAELLINS